MKEDKGKGPAEDHREPGNSLDDGSSVISRVKASAIGLTKSVLAAPNLNEVHESAASALSNSGKGQPSQSNSSSAYAESSRGSQQQYQKPSGSNAFRSGHHEQHVAQTEADFSSFLDGIPVFQSSDHEQLSNSTSSGVDANLSSPVTWGDAWARSQHHENTAHPGISQQYRTIHEQEVTDGADVLELLNTSNLTSHTFSALPGEEIEDDYDWGLSPTQLSQIRAVAKELFPDPHASHTSMPADHPLNLIPHGENTDGSMSSPATEPGMDEMYVSYEIDGQPVTGTQVWRTQWEGVLGRYTDEVWGDLLPLVREARKEVEDIIEGKGTEEPVALRRLKGILGHLQRR